MKVLVIGAGGREHAICAALGKSPKVTEIYCAPGNAGIARIAHCVAIGDTEVDELLRFAQTHSVDLTVRTRGGFGSRYSRPLYTTRT